MSARIGLQPDVLWGQDRGTSSDCLVLDAALVPGHSGSWTGGDSVHHHHLYPEVETSVDQNEACSFLQLLLTHVSFMLMAVRSVLCFGEGSVVVMVVVQ